MGETLDFFRGRLDSMIDLRHPRTPQRQRTILGPLIRELRGKLAVGTLNIGASSFTLSLSSLSSLSTLLERADRIRTQKQNDKNKRYALHAPEVECISKGKARNRYEFAVKVSLALTHQQGLIVGAKRFTGKPFDGHTLAAQIGQTNTRSSPTQAKPLPRPTWTCLGDALHLIACAAGQSTDGIRWLMRAILRLGLKGLFAPLKRWPWVKLALRWSAIGEDHASVNHCQRPACGQAAFSIGWRDGNLNLAGTTS